MQRLVIGITLLATLLFSCTHEGNGNDPYTGDSNVASMHEIQVPEGFDYQMKKVVDFPLTVFATPFEGKAKVEFYTLTAGQGRRSVGSMLVLPVDTVIATVEVPSATTGVFAEATLASGEVVKGRVSLDASEQTLVLESVAPITPKQASITQTYKTTTPGPGCSTGCTTTITSVSGNKLTVPANQVYCVTGGVNGKEIEVGSNAEVRICGSYNNVKGIKLMSGAKLVLNANAYVKIKSSDELQMNQNATVELYDQSELRTSKAIKVLQGNTILNYGTITQDDMNFEIHQGGSVTNHGTITVKEDEFKLTGNGALINHGTVDVDKNDFEAHNQSSVVNYGTIINDKSDVQLTSTATFENRGTLQINMFSSPGGDLVLNNQSVFTNYCSTTINDDLLMYSTAKFINKSALYVVDDIELYNQSTLEMEEQTIATVGDNLKVFGRINAQGTAKSLVKVAGTIDSYASAVYSGPLSVCLTGGTVNFNGATVGGSVDTDCNTYIPTDACKTLGNGTLPDADGDGVVDALDEFPNDAQRVARVTGGVSTLIAEDLWPYTGDYDFNDVVLEYQFDQVIDAQSNIKELTFKYIVKARGAGYDNGFGFTLTTPAANVASVTGGITSNGLATYATNGTEANALSTGSGFIVTDKLRENLPFWNTVPNAVDQSTPQYVSFTIVFTQAVDPAVVLTFNPFLVRDGQRGTEIHLANDVPTDLVNTALFGTGEDATDLLNSVSYVTSTGLPWMMDVPANFNYVVEREDITQAYVNFATWVASGGSLESAWYDATVSQNVNASKLYN